MRLKIYLAAQYRQKEMVANCKAELEALKMKVTSTWTEETESPFSSLKDITDEVLEDYAMRDMREVFDADLLVLFTVDPDALTKRGGRHVEFGYAMGCGLDLVIVGPKENLFHHLKQVKQFETWEDFVTQLKKDNQ